VGRAVGILARDVTITREEIRGLMADLLCTNSPPAGTTKLTEWAYG
jgi:NADH dehydrogenase